MIFAERLLLLLCSMLSLSSSLVCPKGTTLITFKRIYAKAHADGENVAVYSGNSAVGKPIIKMEGKNDFYGRTINEYACLKDITYTIKLTCKFDDGWSYGSRINVHDGNSLIASHTIMEGSLELIAQFKLSARYDYDKEWKYSDVPQVDNSWTIENMTWPSASSFPPMKSTTRYFQKQLIISSVERDEIMGLFMTIQTSYGGIVYINGKEFFTWNMPSGEITSSTSASTVNIPAITEAQSISFDVITSEVIVLLSVELHKAEGGNDPIEFEAYVEFIRYEKSRRIQSNVGEPFGSENETDEDKKLENLFDDDVLTKWRVANPTFPLYAGWKWPEHHYEVVNGYEVSSADDLPDCDPVAWNVYGSNDKNNEDAWVLLDTQTNVTWTYRNETQLFRFENNIRYNAYKIEITGVEDDSAPYLQFSEFSLLMVNYPPDLPRMMYDGLHSYIAATTEFMAIEPYYLGMYTNWTITPALPSGLSFDTKDGAITGFANEGFDSIFTICASSKNGFNFAAYTITALACNENETYVTLSKKTGGWSFYEGFWIKSGDVEVFRPPLYPRYTISVFQRCLPNSPNNQYTLELSHTYGHAWEGVSWLSIQGPYGNIVYKGNMIIEDSENHPLSFYYALKRNETWKLFAGSTIDSSWTSRSYNDANWNSVTIPSDVLSTNKTQYLRKSIVGLDGLAVYELYMRYQYGLVAYIDGMEVARDHMPDGPILSTTQPTGAYKKNLYHGVIRPAYEIQNTRSVLAIELHFPQDITTETIVFDAYIGMYAASTTQGNCFIYPHNTTFVNAMGINNILFDFMTVDYMVYNKTEFPLTYDLVFNGTHPYINGARFYARHYDDFLFYFNIEGSMNRSDWHTIVSQKGPYNRKETNYVLDSTNNAFYNYYRVSNISAVVHKDMRVHEIQLLICSDPSQHQIIEFEHDIYTYYANFENVLIQPTKPDFSNCNISPSLPSGLSLNSDTCIITGIAKNVLESTIFTVTSNVNETSISGTFGLTITECDGTLTKIIRSYKDMATKEAFIIQDAITHDVILQVDENSGQSDNHDVVTILCLTGTKYTITTSSSKSYWSKGSFLTVHTLFSTNDYEPILRVRHDLRLGLPSISSFTIGYSIPHSSDWYYNMGDVPSHWYSEQLSGWKHASKGSYPESKNQIQLYKKVFDVTSIDHLAGFVISLRYQYGCIIYVNEHEVFRKGINGDLSTSSMSSNTYSSCNYHQISLPIKTMAIDASSSISYIKKNSNVIAVGLIADSASHKSSSFDCTLRLMEEGSVSRLFDYTTVSQGLTPSDELNELSNESITTCTNCNLNEWTTLFNNDRHEWISSIRLYAYDIETQPTNLIVKARNKDEEWITLKTITELHWSANTVYTKIILENNKPYQQYQLQTIKRIASDSSEWKLTAIDFYADTLTTTIPTLTYPISLILYTNMNMDAIYPTIESYYDFTSTLLPDGLHLNKENGMLSGLPTTVQQSMQYTINAKKYGGESTNAIISIEIKECSNTLGFVHLVIMNTDYPAEAGYSIYGGDDTSGSIVASKSKLVQPHYAIDLCLPHNLYTLQLIDDNTEGWSTSSGYYISVNDMIIESAQFPSGTNNITTLFTTNEPFVFETSEWKIMSSVEIPSFWQMLSFNDISWPRKTASEFGSHQFTTVYLRHDIMIPDILTYYYLNIRIKYKGGIIAYFNNRRVARFNLPDNITSSTPPSQFHSSPVYSMFHISFAAMGGRTGKNVIAFEVHGTVNSPIVFDASSVFGVKDYAIAATSITNAVSSDGTPLSSLFDLIPSNKIAIPSNNNDWISWSTENLEGALVNLLGFHSTVTSNQLGFMIEARSTSEESYQPVTVSFSHSFIERETSVWDMINSGDTKYRDFKFNIKSSPDVPIEVYSLSLRYHKPVKSSCPNYLSCIAGTQTCVIEGEDQTEYYKCAGSNWKKEYTCYDLPYESEYKAIPEQTVTIKPQSGSGSYRLVTGSLPIGLELSPTSGEITGLSPEAGSFTIQIEVIISPDCSGLYSITIKLETLCPSYLTCSAGTLHCHVKTTEGTDYYTCLGNIWHKDYTCYNHYYEANYTFYYDEYDKYDPKVQSGQFSLLTGSLPTGIQLTSTTGRLSGSSTKISTSAIQIQSILTAECNATDDISISVKTRCPSLLNCLEGTLTCETSIDDGMEYRTCIYDEWHLDYTCYNHPYEKDYTFTAGDAIAIQPKSGDGTYRIISGVLPEGLELSTKTGHITGSSSDIGSFDMIVRVSISSKCSLEAEFRIVIKIPVWFYIMIAVVLLLLILCIFWIVCKVNHHNVLIPKKGNNKENKTYNKTIKQQQRHRQKQKNTVIQDQTSLLIVDEKESE